MAFSSIPSADIAAGKPVDVDLMANIKDNDDALFGSLGGAAAFDIPNGDMEVDSDVSGFPDNWAETTYPGGTAGLETAAPLNGSQSMSFIHPGGASNGGGEAYSDYMPCGYQAPFRVSWLNSSTEATIHNYVQVFWYDKDKVTVAPTYTTLYDSIANPTSATQLSAVATPPAGAKFYKIRLIGGYHDTDTVGGAGFPAKILFDAVTVERARVRSYTVPSSVSSVVLTDVRFNIKTVIDIFGLTTSAAASLYLNVSADNGATWVTTTVYYVGATGAAQFSSGSLGAGSTTDATYTIKDLGAAKYTTINLGTIIRATAPSIGGSTVLGGINTTTAYNAIKFSLSTGTIDAGVFNIEELY